MGAKSEKYIIENNSQVINRVEYGLNNVPKAYLTPFAGDSKPASQVDQGFANLNPILSSPI